MKAGTMFVAAILAVDSFFVSYFVGMHSKTVDVEDPSIKPLEQPAAAASPKQSSKKAEESDKKAERASEKKKSSKSHKKTHKGKSHAGGE